MLQWIEENIQHDKEFLKLDCVGHNLTLNDFYKRCGFEFIGSTDGHSMFQKNSIVERNKKSVGTTLFLTFHCL